MYIARKIYEGVKAIPASVYEIAFSAGVIAFASFMAMRSPSELERKVVEQKPVAPAGGGGGGSYGPKACPPILNGNFGTLDYGDFDREKNNSILIPEKLKASLLQPSQK